jgi:hypothetical protein
MPLPFLCKLRSEGERVMNSNEINGTGLSISEDQSRRIGGGRRSASLGRCGDGDSGDAG